MKTFAFYFTNDLDDGNGPFVDFMSVEAETEDDALDALHYEHGAMIEIKTIEER